VTKQRVCIGVITGVHGVRGAVRIKSFTEDPASVAAYGPVEDEAGTRRFGLRVIGASKGVVLGRIEGIDDRNAAEALKGLRFYVDRAALPPPEAEEFYHADLLGLGVELPDGTPFGRVKAVHSFGAGDTLEVERAAGDTILVPFTKAAVPVVDLAGGRLVLDPPAGLLEKPEPESSGPG
jgi:16S rRNA processing protein RimM